jgi:serine/threonine-protein kinase HipA
MKKNGHAGLEDFQEFAKRLNISVKRRDKMLEPFLTRQEHVEILVQRSFLNDQTKRAYLLQYQTRRNQLNAQ